MMSRNTVLLAIAALVVVVATQSFFIVSETNQAIVTQLGEYRFTASNPGIYAKLPFAQTAVYVDRRLLSTDATAQEYLTLDKKRLRVDHVTRWRIVDPLLFYVTVRTEAGARARLDDVVFSELRRELASQPFDLVIAERREQIMGVVTRNAAQQAVSYGIAVEDVRIKRADLPSEVQQSVFDRMKAERSREANRYRAEGAEQAAQIRATADRERTIILADAYEEAQRLRGQGEAEATAIYATALEQDPEFYSFIRRLEAYGKLLRKGDTLVLPANADLFTFLTQHSGSTRSTQPTSAP